MKEGALIDSTIGDIAVNGDSNVTYSLIGENSSDFRISPDENQTNNNPDYSLNSSYSFTFTVEGENDTTQVPLNINISENLDPTRGRLFKFMFFKRNH